MRKDIHTKLNEVKVTCSTCSKDYVFHTTKKELEVDVCANCHSFYTGVKNNKSSAGRVDRFNRRRQATARFKK